jgi:nitrate reductase alpha subunit
MGGGKGDLAEMMKSMKDLPFMKMLEKTLGGKVDMNAMNRMTQQSATKERMLKKMEQRQQMQQQMQAQQASAQMQQTGSNSYVVKIGDEKQEKSGLKPPTTFVAPIASPAPALSEEELIKLFNAESSSKKQKKPKKAK